MPAPVTRIATTGGRGVECTDHRQRGEYGPKPLLETLSHLRPRRAKGREAMRQLKTYITGKNCCMHWSVAGARALLTLRARELAPLRRRNVA